MTFCLGMKVQGGLVGIADTRITSGAECITAKKLSIFQHAGHSLFVMTSGLRSVRDKVITYFEEVLDETETEFDRLHKALNALAAQTRRVAAEDKEALENSKLNFNFYALVGGQMKNDREHKLYLLYPQGNWVEVGAGTPYCIIGETGYGKPILDRTLKYADSMQLALKVGALAFDSTRISSTTVDFPLDVVIFERDSQEMFEYRYEKPQLAESCQWWQERLRASLNELPSQWLENAFARPEQRATQTIPISGQADLYQRKLNDVGWFVDSISARRYFSGCTGMLFHIKHTTRYSYSRTVFCEPFMLRLRPREDASQRLVRFQRSIHPQPAGVSDVLDFEGNTASHCWFNGPTCLLTITVNSVVETLRENPFDFLLENSAIELPVGYRSETCAALAPYRTVAEPSAIVQELAERVKIEVKQNTVQFLVQLASWISENFEKTVRPEGEPFPAEMTLQARQGSCRDLAVLFAEVCRCVGLAARFVSGYHSHVEADGERHLHAWTEVFLPGAGWRGFDPGLGLAVANQHVVIATGLNALAAAPVVGTFRGNGNSTLETQVVIRVS